MGINTNFTGDAPKLIKELWPTFWGLVFVWVLEILISIWSFQALKLDSLLFMTIWGAFLFVTTFLIWTIHTKRWFQRTSYLILIHYVGIICVGACVYLWIYPFLIKGTGLDIALIRYWLTAIVVIALMACSYYNVCKKRDGLCIVFMVKNRSQHEHDIMQALVAARDKVEETANNIQIVIPPFGIAETPKGCKRYINSHFNQADAVIFASLIDSPQGSEFGYSFNGFTSMMSDRYVKKENRDDESVKMLMDESYRCHEWNTLNINTNQISRQLEVASNLTHLFLMYVSCIYLQKHKYSDAIGVADALYTYSITGIKRYDDAIRELLAHSYITAQYIEEYDNQDYGRALEILDECVQKLPQMRSTLTYDLSMARIHFYEGNLQESKNMTKRAKARHSNADWYVAVNLAFYAIYEKKPKELFSHYKRMLKMQKQDKKEVDYAIRFLKIEASKSNDRAYLMFLCHGIAFLYLYFDQSRSDKYLKQTRDYAGVNGYQELEEMRNLIQTSRGKLKVKQKGCDI